MEQTENLLGCEKVGRLLRKFSIPCAISLIVAALYNIVDQIFIGWSEAGAYGNAATNIVYPITVFTLGFALMIGDGASSNFSIFLGRGNRKEADRSVGNGLLGLIILAVIITAVALIFSHQILALFGANPTEELCYGYAVDYYTVISMGIPVYMIGQGLNASIRADGSPKYAMACTLAGAIANIILDPIFIFVFGMGVKGAAIATVIGQVITCVMSIVYLFRSKSFKITKESMRINGRLMGKICSVGLASLIVQLSIVVISVVNNNLLAKYGYETAASTGEMYGAITPLAVVGIVMKVFGIVISIAVGIGLGGQPIIGFNMGAGNIDRVKKCVKLISATVLIVGAVAFLIFELAPDVIISIFGSGNTPEYIEFARLCIRIFLGGIILTCFIKACSIMLQSMGNSLKSTLVALIRDVIVFVPATIIIAEISRNIVTMLWSAVISDVIGTIVAFIMLRLEIRRVEKAAQPERSGN